MTVGHVRHARTCANLEVVDGKNSVADIENALLWDKVYTKEYSCANMSIILNTSLLSSSIHL